MEIEALHKHDEKNFKSKPEVGVKKLNLKPDEKRNQDERLAKGELRVVIEKLDLNFHRSFTSPSPTIPLAIPISPLITLDSPSTSLLGSG